MFQIDDWVLIIDQEHSGFGKKAKVTGFYRDRVILDAHLTYSLYALPTQLRRFNPLDGLL